MAATVEVRCSWLSARLEHQPPSLLCWFDHSLPALVRAALSRSSRSSRSFGDSMRFRLIELCIAGPRLVSARCSALPRSARLFRSGLSGRLWSERQRLIVCPARDGFCDPPPRADFSRLAIGATTGMIACQRRGPKPVLPRMALSSLWPDTGDLVATAVAVSCRIRPHRLPADSGSGYEKAQSVYWRYRRPERVDLACGPQSQHATVCSRCPEAAGRQLRESLG